MQKNWTKWGGKKRMGFQEWNRRQDKIRGQNWDGEGWIWNRSLTSWRERELAKGDQKSWLAMEHITMPLCLQMPILLFHWKPMPKKKTCRGDVQKADSLSATTTKNWEFQASETEIFPCMAKESKHTSDSHIYRPKGQGKSKLWMKPITSHHSSISHEDVPECKAWILSAVHFYSFSLDLRKTGCASRPRRTKTSRVLNSGLCTPQLNIITSLHHLLMSDSAPLTSVTQLLNKIPHCDSFEGRTVPLCMLIRST